MSIMNILVGMKRGEEHAISKAVNMIEKTTKNKKHKTQNHINNNIIRRI